MLSRVTLSFGHRNFCSYCVYFNNHCVNSTPTQSVPLYCLCFSLTSFYQYCHDISITLIVYQNELINQIISRQMYLFLCVTKLQCISYQMHLRIPNILIFSYYFKVELLILLSQGSDVDLSNFVSKSKSIVQL